MMYVGGFDGVTASSASNKPVSAVESANLDAPPVKKGTTKICAFTRSAAVVADAEASANACAPADPPMANTLS
jgi:hypothetical protein